MTTAPAMAYVLTLMSACVSLAGMEPIVIRRLVNRWDFAQVVIIFIIV